MQFSAGYSKSPLLLGYMAIVGGKAANLEAVLPTFTLILSKSGEETAGLTSSLTLKVHPNHRNIVISGEKDGESRGSLPHFYSVTK